MLKINMIKILLKFILAAALLYWLKISGKLDFSLVRKSIEMGPEWIYAFTAILVQAWLASLRYKILLQSHGQKKLHYLDIVKINYIGQFFSTILPGAVTGDVIKLVYVNKLNDKFNKTFIITTTLLDRILGVTGLLFLSGVFSLIYFHEVTAISSKITHIIYINFSLFLGASIFWAVLVGPHHFQRMMLKWLNKIPVLGDRIFSLLDQLFKLRERRLDLALSFLLSIIIQFLGILTFWVISSPFYSGHLPLQYAFTFIPIGLIATAIPISPGGLGVGHVLFANLFSLINITNGASLFNLYFLINLTHNLLGAIPYLMMKTQTISALDAQDQSSLRTSIKHTER